MATKTYYLSGKAKWAHVHRIDKYDKYSITLYPDEASLNQINEWVDGTPPIMNHLKEDEDGQFMKFGCPPNRLIAGKIVPFTIEVLDNEGRPFHQPIGNGSDVTIKVDVYTYRKGEGKAVRLRAVRIDNLVPFTSESFPDDETRESAAELMSQPQPNF